MDIEGVYNEEEREDAERRIAEEKRRRAQMPIKIKPFEGNEYKTDFTKTVGSVYRGKDNLFIFKSKKTRGQVLNEFKSKVQFRAEELDAHFVSSVQKLVETDVERVYLPVLYVKIKKTRKSGEYSDTVHNNPPVYLSIVGGTKTSKTHYLHNFSSTVQCFQTASDLPTNGEAGELSLTKQEQAPVLCAPREVSYGYYNVNARATKEDLESIDDVLQTRVFDAPYVSEYEKLMPGETVKEYEILQTLLFPVWVVRVPFHSKSLHYYVSDCAAEPSCYNMPYNEKTVRETEERLCALHARKAPFKTAMAIAFIGILIFGLISFGFHIFAMDESTSIYPHLTMVLYVVLLVAHIANLAASLRSPFAAEIPYSKLEITRKDLEKCESENIAKKFFTRFLIAAVILALVITDFCICQALLSV